MYRKTTAKWLKHLDFILLDLICLQIAYVLAYALAGYGFGLYSIRIYRVMAVILELTDAFFIILLELMKNVLKRGYYKEFVKTVKHAAAIIIAVIAFLYLFKLGQSFSRKTMIWTAVLYIMLSYSTRMMWKKFYFKNRYGSGPSLFVICSSDTADEVINDITLHNYSRYQLSGMALTDVDLTGKIIHGVPVVASFKQTVDYICQHYVDEVLIAGPEDSSSLNELVEELVETGVTVHYCLKNIINISGTDQSVGKVGEYNVLTTNLKSVSDTQMILKRLIDIAGGLVGCIVTGILCIFIGPAIYASSPGPIFYGSTRVGRNGKEFKMYKFRSMYPDADQRKAELMNQNRMSDGRMFKIDFDPRIIGNKVLPDGTRKTGIGEFIRKTSLDEFPQFFNVLKGDMSLVGTRPPLPSETALYETHHHVRLAVKPGITGMWQVSGRSNITDFEEVVRLDKEYIEKWSIGLDVKILLKTVLVVLKRDGSM